MTRKVYRAGFSLIEMMITMVIMGMVIAGSVSGWLFVIFGERWNSTQDKLDLDVRMSLENIRRDLRLTTMNKMYFAPAGVGPYTAVSFPIAVDDDGDGLIELDSNTNIIWDVTKVYHRYGTGMEFRVTTITNRDNTLTDAQRQAQLDYISANGTAAGTYEAAKASTRTLFRNLFTWNVSIDAAIFDSYSATVDRESAMTLGSVILSNGTHSYKFTVVGKNASSSSYKLGLDAMSVSPSGGQREMEKQTITAQSGASAVVEPMTNAQWSGNNHLAFPATATGQYITLSMVNDAWEDENFAGTGAASDDSTVVFDDTLTPKDFVVKLLGSNYTWTAAEQTQDFAGSGGGANEPPWGNYGFSYDNVLGCAVRVLLRGSQMMDGGYIKFDGQAYYVIFSTALARLKINKAYIAQCVDATNITPNAVDTGVQLKFNGTSDAYEMSNVGTNWWVRAWPVGAPFNIDRDKSYVISYLVDNTAGKGNAAYWLQGGGVTAPGCYVIPAASAPDDTMTRDPVWAGMYGSYETSQLFAVMGFYAYYPSNGTYQSAIYDTHQAAPVFQDMTWTADLPAGTGLRFKVRSSSDEFMTGAADWSSLSWMASPGTISPGANRYVQYFSELVSSVGGGQSPRLKNVAIRFAGEQKVVDIGGSFTKGPNYGVFELTVDGLKLQKGVTVAMQVYSDIATPGAGTKRLVSKASVEVEPRNTGK